MPRHVKNNEEILLATDQVRGERIREKDKSLFFFGIDQRKQVRYGLSIQDTIEFAVLDTENNLLHWEDQGLKKYKLVKYNIVTYFSQ